MIKKIQLGHNSSESPVHPKLSEELYKFCFSYYNSERWVADDNVVEAKNAEEARKLLREKIGEEKYSKMPYPVRTIFYGML